MVKSEVSTLILKLGGGAESLPGNSPRAVPEEEARVERISGRKLMVDTDCELFPSIRRFSCPNKLAVPSVGPGDELIHIEPGLGEDPLRGDQATRKDFSG